MSHVAKVKIKILDLVALKAACKALGLEFREGQKTFKWYGRWVNDFHGSDAAYKHGIKPEDYGKCEHAIGIPNNKQAYEIGLVKDGDGYSMIYDFWNGGYGIEAIAGKSCSNLAKAYSKEVALKKLKYMGYSCTTKTNSQGEVEITAVKY